ncbi:MAG: protein-L-isoaspartate(D-aspartate) O-methyltransferase [Planctomycetes bacterium]|nr:protein-L-isoaspartate(D-aspartate) O-methyltransferase [Planctomycetota bacterium]
MNLADRQVERDRMANEQLVAREIRDAQVLDVLRRVPRHCFVPPQISGRAYEDNALPVECGQTISQPYIVARMTELLAIRPTHRLLEIGTGTGYQTAVLAELAREVWSVEWHLSLLTSASERLARLGYRNVRIRCGDGSLGWPEHAPFDGVIVTAGAPQVPPALLEQLAPDGRLVIPVGGVDSQELLVVHNSREGFRTVPSLGCRFVKLRGAAGWAEFR